MTIITGGGVSENNNGFVMKESDEIELRKKLSAMFESFKVGEKPLIDPEFVGQVSTDIISIIEEYIGMKYNDK